MSDKVLVAAVVVFVSLGFVMLNLRSEVASARMTVNEVRQMVIEMNRRSNLSGGGGDSTGKSGGGHHGKNGGDKSGGGHKGESSASSDDPEGPVDSVAPDPNDDALSSDAPKAGATKGATSPESSRAAQVLASIMILEYEPKMAVTDAQADKIRTLMASFKKGQLNDTELEKRFTRMLTKDQRTWLGKRTDEIDKKVAEFDRLHVDDEKKYADLAIDLLERSIRPDSQ